MYKEIDVETWKRKGTYNYFKTFSNPCYGFDVEMDIDDLYKISKETKTSFFVNMCYLTTIGLNMTEELRLRILDGKVIEHEVCNPSYTIMTDDGFFQNGRNIMCYDYQKFYKECKDEVERYKHNLVPVSESFNDSKTYEEFYMTCIPQLKYEGMCHPIPDKSIESQSVPRICWGKYYEKDGRMKILLNITVSHILCDGYPLAQAFLRIQEVYDKAKEYLK